MNYRHGFHAGNFADVLKHVVLMRILSHLNAKDKPWRVVDTHAGAGRYDLGSEEALKTHEWRDGVARPVQGVFGRIDDLSLLRGGGHTRVWRGSGGRRHRGGGRALVFFACRELGGWPFGRLEEQRGGRDGEADEREDSPDDPQTRAERAIIHCRWNY